MLANRSVNPAARRWQIGLTTALKSLGLGIFTLGHMAEPIWPRGRARIRDRDSVLAEAVEGKLVSYWNLPGLRTRSLTARYRESFEDLCLHRGSPMAIISYNAYPYNAALGLQAQVHASIPWICIVADAPAAGPNRERHDRAIDQAAGRIFLSWMRFEMSDRHPSLHLDGGVDGLRFDTKRQEEQSDAGKSVVLYAGSMNRWAGVSLLISAFRLVNARDAELWICGPDFDKELAKAANNDSRISLLGKVSEARLVEISRIATLFVNPRPATTAGNESNFPSKVLEYLSYGKPVVSTWTDGLEPEYRNVLVVVEKDTPESLAQSIDQVLAWSGRRRHETRVRTEKFLNEHKLWSLQAQRMTRWLSQDVLHKDLALVGTNGP